MTDISDENGAENTDRELWRDRFGSDSIHVTKGGGIGINCGGMVYVMPIREWHRLASLASRPAEISDKAVDAAKTGVKAWLDEVENYSTRGERMFDEVRRGIINPWLETAYALGFSAALPHLGAAGVAVRELEWDVLHERFHTAKTSIGSFYVEDMGANWSHDRYQMRFRNESIAVKCATLEAAKAAAQQNFNQRIRSALVPSPVPQEATAEPVAWRDDPSADERWNAGLDFGMTQLCALLGVDEKAVTWDAATETLDGDVRAVLGNILRAKYGENWGAADPAPPSHDAELLAALREALTFARDAIWSGCDAVSAVAKIDAALSRAPTAQAAASKEGE